MATVIKEKLYSNPEYFLSRKFWCCFFSIEKRQKESSPQNETKMLVLTIKNILNETRFTKRGAA